MNDLLLRACRREPVERPPVWLMRQAGRYLPEYRAIRARHDFLTMVATPEIAAQVTLQPVDILGVDAAIIFSDILVVPQAMGMTLSVEEGVGPRFHQPIQGPGDWKRLRTIEPENELDHVLAALRLTRRELDGRVPLIGFAGGPWTLASYMIEGGGSKTFARAKRWLAQAPDLAHSSLGMLAASIGSFLRAQVTAGAQVVQVFESSAGALSPADFRTFALPYLSRVVEEARRSGAPVIVFAPGAGWALPEIVSATGADVVGIDWQTEPAVARRGLDHAPVGIQGNLDPAWLYRVPEEIRARTRAMVEEFGVLGYIANLGHGVLPDTPVAHVKAFVDAVREFR
jgi:uroporphyrinogen decarboxylase